MTDRELMQQALDAMLNLPDDISDEMFESIKALKKRLAQPEPPPECKTEEEKTAFSFGYWKAMEAQRVAQPEQNNSRQLDWAKVQADHWKQHCFDLMKQLQEKNT